MTPTTPCSTRINGSGALPSPELVNHFLAQKPAHIVRSGGLELARIYDVRNQPPPEFVHIDTTGAADFGDRIRLAAYRLDKQSVSPGDRATVTLYLKKLAETDAAYNVLLRLVAPDGAEIWRDEGWPAGEPTADWPVDEMRFDDHQIGIPGDATAGRYRLLLSFYDPKTAALLPLADGRVAHEVVSLAVQAPGADDPTNVPSAPTGQDRTGEAAPTPRMRDFDVSASWGDVQITRLQHAPQLNPGQPLRVELAAAVASMVRARSQPAWLTHRARCRRRQTNVCGRICAFISSWMVMRSPAPTRWLSSSTIPRHWALSRMRRGTSRLCCRRLRCPVKRHDDSKTEGVN